jgi:hypothetical protein
MERVTLVVFILVYPLIGRILGGASRGLCGFKYLMDSMPSPQLRKESKPDMADW